jgi:hypothetical protein
MNQDAVKAMLLSVEEPRTEFTLIFSGKSSKKCNGLYKPDTREIILHNRNFEDDNQLAYTALHEYAHHLHAERSGGMLSPRAHGPEFWGIFHGLLEKAEKAGVYRNLYEESPRLVDITRRIKDEFLPRNGLVMKEFGRLLIEAEAACREAKARFEDYIDRVIGLPKASVKAAMRVSALDIDEAIGFDNMKLVAGIRKPEMRVMAVEALKSGKSPDFVKTELSGKARPDEDPKERLAKEAARIERTIASLEKRLAQVKARLAEQGE